MLLMISMRWKTIMSSSQLENHLFKRDVRPFQRESNRAQFLLSSCRTRRMFMDKNEHKSENWKMLRRFLCKVCHHLHKGHNGSRTSCLLFSQ